MPRTAHRTGLRGEDRAERLGIARGWQPLARRVRIAGTELDVVMQRTVEGRRELLVLEVKTSTITQPEQALRWTPRQQARLWRAVEPLAAMHQADTVRVALVVVQLRADTEQLTWLDAEPPL